MLITFKSKAAAEVLMYGVHAKPILDLLGKEVERGVITADEAGEAVRRIESEIAERHEQEQKSANAQATDDDDAPDPRGTNISFGTRAYPLLEMLRAANREHHFVMWGV
jgi:hypothetical protein